MAERIEVKVLCGACPDSHCGNMLYFLSQVNPEVVCTKCGQKHKIDSLLNVKESTDSNMAVGNLLKSILLSNTAAKKGSELVKVRGLSNFHCKLVSPLLTSYGMDKKTGKAKLLSELGQGEIFNCAVFGNRAFLIEKDYLDTPGYGKDDTGSLGYLKDTLEMIKKANDGECLVPIHSDGDGHCLVHAISRAVVGRELLWHSLRQNLKDSLQQDSVKYQALFRDFIDANEWDDIVNEADPNYHPATNEPFGLRNMHVFGLANVLHRPIILLDSLEGMQSSGDYSGIFLPVLVPIESCKSQETLNKPLAIAWSSLGRNHYVPLVGVRDSVLPKIPRSLLPKAWGVPNQLVQDYIEFDENNCCVIGGSRSLPESYVQRLVSSMNKIFFEKHEISPELVADVHQFVFKPSDAVGFSIPEIIEFTQNALKSESLFQCLSCQALKEVKDTWPRSWREPKGRWYTTAQETKPGLVTDAVYQFDDAPGVLFLYQLSSDMLVPANKQDPQCDLCGGVVREVRADGSVRYVNGDRTSTKTASNSHGCKCGFKHYWNSRLHDNHPQVIDVSLEWNGKTIEEKVFWFDNESDSSLNSNVFELATSVVQKHFPGEFGSETIERKVVDKILRETELKKIEEASVLSPNIDSQSMDTDSQQTTLSSPSKIIITGPKQKTLHKEELTMNEEERLTKARITHRAAYSQKRKSTTKESPEKPSGSTKHGKQEVQKAIKNNTQSQSVVQAPKQVNSSQVKPSDDIKIRLTSSSGKAVTITLKPDSNYAHLQETIEAELGIPKDRQKIRYGFPPQELKPPEDEKEKLPLSRGDRVSVEELPDLNIEKEEESSKESETESMDVEVKETEAVEENSTSFNDELRVDREKIASDLLSLLQGALNNDQWEMVQHSPELFARGGMIYEQTVSKIGPLKDDMHFNITALPGKTFAYNEKEDRLEICLGQEHIPVQPLDAETLSRAHNRTNDPTPMRRPREEREGLGTFSGALRHRDAAQGRTAFSGAGRTLGGSAKTEEKKEEALVEMQVDCLHETSTDAQNTSEDPKTSGVIMDNVEPKPKESTIMDTQGDVDLLVQSLPTDTEKPSGENEEHEKSSLEHEVTKVEHANGNDSHEKEVGEHEIKVSPNEGNPAEHGENNAEHVVSDVKNAMEVDDVKTPEHVLSSGEQEVEKNEHEVEKNEHETQNESV